MLVFSASLPSCSVMFERLLFFVADLCWSSSKKKGHARSGRSASSADVVPYLKLLPFAAKTALFASFLCDCLNVYVYVYTSFRFLNLRCVALRCLAAACYRCWCLWVVYLPSCPW
mmetsp:Transcript_37698/g.91726  ORF Transcript_37698/g.91726 Transcript_37698/m.91726 type:complete len:115 (-) Transcript_37698:74-418(-)